MTTGVTLMAGQSRRYIAALAEAHQRRAELGRIFHIAYTLTRHYDRSNAPTWWRSIVSTGGLVITQLGAHAIDFGLWFMDGKKPVSVYAAENRGQTVGQVRHAFLRVVNQAGGAELARHDLTEDASTETAMVFGELYRHGAEWKFRAIGPGYASGLRGIAQDFGVNV